MTSKNKGKCVFGTERVFKMRMLSSRTLAFLGCFAVMLTLSSCISQVYVPTAPAAPLLERRGDLAISGNLSIATAISGSIAYAFFDNLSLLAEGSYDAIGQSRSSEHSWKGINLGLGFQSRGGDSLKFDLYAGVGRGSGVGVHVEEPEWCLFCFRDDWREERRTELATSNIFAVGSIGYRWKMISLIANARVAYVHVDNFHTSWERIEEGIQVASSWQSAQSSFFSFEGTLMLRINGAWGLDPFGYVTFASPSPRTMLDEDHYLGGNIGIGWRYSFNLIE